MDLKRLLPQSVAIAISTFSLVLTPTSYSQSSESSQIGGYANALYEKAMSAYEQGDINTAVIHVKNALKEDSNNLPARLLFAQILLEYGELAAAEDQYRVALSLNADKSIVIIPLAQSLLLQSKHSTILTDINIGPYSPQVNTLVYVYRAKANTGLNKLDEAKFNYEQALTLDEGNIDALLGLSTIAKKQLDPLLARQYLMQAKAIAPNDPYVAFFEGEQFRQSLKLDEAVSAYNEAILLKEDYLDARRSRAAIYLDQNKLPEAKLDIEFLLSKQPNDPFAQLLHGIYLAKTNNSIEAKNVIAQASEKFSQIEPETIEQFAPLALIYGFSQYLQGNLQNATTSLNGYLQKNPSSKQAREVLAEIASQRKQYDLAADLLQPVAPDQLTTRSAHIMLRSLIETQRYSQAIEFINSLPGKITDKPEMKNLHAVVLLKSGKAKQAIDLLSEQTSNDSFTADNQAMLILGYNYLNLGFAKEALQSAKQLEQLFAENDRQLSITDLNFIGSAYLVNGDDNQAKEYFKKALVIDKEDEIVNRNLAQLYLKNAEYSNAQAIIEGILAKNPDNLNMLPIYGELLIAQNDNKSALAVYEQINELSPQNLKNKYQLANSYLANNQPQKAIDTANDINRLESLSPFALIVKAKANIQLNDLSQAARSLRIAFGLFTEDPEKLVEIAKLQLSAQDYLSVEKSIATISKLDSKQAQLHTLQVQLLEATGELENALKLLRQQKKKDGLYYRLEANILLKLYRDQEALNSAKTAYKLEPIIDNHELVIRCLLINKKLPESYVQFNDWLSNHPYDWRSWRKFANLYEQHGLVDEAIQAYLESININNKDIFSLNNVANLLVDKGNYTDALTHAKSAYQYAPLEAKVNDTYGWVLVHNNQADTAVNYFRESLARDNNNATTRFHLGVTLQQLDRNDEALTQLYQALSAAKSDTLKAIIKQAIDGKFTLDNQ